MGVKLPHDAEKKSSPAETEGCSFFLFAVRPYMRKAGYAHKPFYIRI
jgi:hypothetical protein